MATQAGYLGAIKLDGGSGEVIVLEMATWAVSGMETDMLEDTEFEDNYKSYVPGQSDGGIVTVSGNYDPEDDSADEGQGSILTKWASKTALTSFKCFYNNTGYWGMSAGNVYVQSVEIGTDQTGLATFGFVVKLSGGYFAKQA